MKTLCIAIGLMLCIFGAACATTKPLLSTVADLDGNGKKEKIWITTVKEDKNHGEHFILHIDKASVIIHAEKLLRFVIIDIDRSDKYKEIDVQTNSGGDGTDHRIYWYDGKNINEIDKLYLKVDYKGNGIVLNSTWTGNVMITEKYVLDKKTRKLKKIPQEMYYVGSPHKVLISFPVFYSRHSNEVVANVERNSNILVLAYAPNPVDPKTGDSDIMYDWFLVKTQSGLLGWVQLQTLAQYVEGMQGAG